MITIIAAVTSDRYALGRGGDMLYYVGADLRRFKELTSGHTVVMGRKTFESLPKGALPNRRNIVVSRRPGFTVPGAETAASLEEALALAAAPGEDEVFIIGGGEIYRQAYPAADRLLITELDAPTPADADTFLDRPDPSAWTETSRSETAVDSRSGVPYRFLTFIRNKAG